MRIAAVLTLLIGTIVGLSPPAAATEPPPGVVTAADPAQCGAELPGGRCAEPVLIPPESSKWFYEHIDSHWIPQPRSAVDSRLLSEALRIPVLLHEGCEVYPKEGQPIEGGEGYGSYLAAEAGLLKLLERDDGRKQLVRAFAGSPGIIDRGPEGQQVNVKGGSYQACLDLLAPNWRNLGEEVKTRPGWRQVVLDLSRVPALIGQPGTAGATFCHNDTKHTDWDFTMAYVIRVWGMMRDEPEERLGISRKILENIVAERAWLQGPGAEVDHRICDGAPGVPETENHEWLIRTTRLLHNELLPALNFKFPRRVCESRPFGCHYPDPLVCSLDQACVPKPECNPHCEDADNDSLPWPQQYYSGNNTNNETNGLYGYMQGFMSGTIEHDWLEYNARPYSRAQMVGLLNVFDFTTHEPTRELARRLLNAIAIKHVAESMDHLRIVPFRRIAADRNENLFQGGMVGPMFAVWVGGLVAPQFAPGDPGGVTGEMAIAAASMYRPPDWLLDTMFDRNKRDFLQGFDGRGQREWAYGGPDFVITGGGQKTRCPYEELGFCFGSGNDAGTVEPVVLIPRRRVTTDNPRNASFPTYRDMIHIQTPMFGLPTFTNTCIDRNFACGAEVVVPDNLVKNSPECKATVERSYTPRADLALRFDKACNYAPEHAPGTKYDGDCFFVYTGTFRHPGTTMLDPISMGFFVTHSCDPAASEADTTKAFHAFVDFMRTNGAVGGHIADRCDNGEPPFSRHSELRFGLKVPPPTPVDLTGVTETRQATGLHRSCPGTLAADGGVDGRVGSRPTGVMSGELTLDGDSRFTPTRLALSQPSGTSYFGQTVTLEAIVTPNGGRAGAGGSVTFYDGVRELGTVPVSPGEGGVVKATLNASGLSVGRHRITAGYSGDARFNTSVSDVEHTVLKAPTALNYTGATSGTYHEHANLAATLTNAATGTPIADAPVVFTLNGQESCTQRTDGAGSAACVVIPNEPAGDYPLAFSYAGDDNYLPTNAERQFTVHKQRTALTYTGTTHIANATPARLSAVLKEDGIIGRAPIAGRSVTLALGEGASRQSCTASTDDAGAVACTIDAVDQPLSEDATVPVSVTFDGDPFYLPAQASAAVKLQYQTGRAYGLAAGVHLPLLSVDLQPTPDTGPVRTAHAINTNGPCTAMVTALVVTARELCENVTTSVNPGSVAATSTLSETTIGVPGIPVITVSGVRAESTSRCGNSTGTTTIATLTIAGQPVSIPSQPNSTINLAGGAQLTINEQKPVPGADSGLTVTAVHLTGLGGLVDVTVGSTSSAAHNCG